MSQPLPYDESKFEKNVCLNEILNTPDNSDIGYFLKVNLSILITKDKKTNDFPFAPENKEINPNFFSDYMKEVKPDTYTQTKKLKSDWSDKKKYLIHYRMLNIYDGQGMVVDKVHEIISIRQSKLLEKYINFNTQKRHQAVK